LEYSNEADLRAELAMAGAERTLLKPTAQAVWSEATKK
jgi:hypothetical protein